MGCLVIFVFWGIVLVVGSFGGKMAAKCGCLDGRSEENLVEDLALGLLTFCEDVGVNTGGGADVGVA